MSRTEKVAGVTVGAAGGSRNSPRALTALESHIRAPLPTCSPLSSDHPQPGTSHHRNARLPPGHLASAGPTCVLGPLTCRGWGGDSCQTEVARGAGSRGDSEARRTTETARGAGQALGGHGEKHPGDRERDSWRSVGPGGSSGEGARLGKGHAFWVCPSTARPLHSVGLFLPARVQESVAAPSPRTGTWAQALSS